MAHVAVGDQVTVHYKGWLEDGNLFASSDGGDPLDYVAGDDQLIGGLSQAVVGMSVGDRKQVTVTAEQGYGEYNPKLEKTVPINLVPEGIKVGDQLQVNSTELMVWVRQLTETHAIVDGNHPLAGKSLKFEIELVAMEPGESTPPE